MSDTTLPNGFGPVIHPLDDVPEEKLYHPALGRMPMSRTVRAMLWLLQTYLAGMMLLLLWRVAGLL
jgi:hypothetical protein